MKKIILFTCFVLLLLNGCGGSSNTNDNKSLEIKYNSSAATRKAIVPENTSPDGYNDNYVNAVPLEFNNATYGGNSELKAVYIIDGVEQPIPNEVVVNWSIPEEGIMELYPFTNNMIKFASSISGRYEITAQAEGLLKTITVCVFDQVITGWFSSQFDYGATPGVIFATKEGTHDQAEADLFLTRPTNDYTFTAPGGIELIKTCAQTRFDRDIKMELANISIVPSELKFEQKTAVIPRDYSGLMIVKTRSGGYAKAVFAKGQAYYLNSPPLFFEYSPNGTFDIVF
jgi:hypothetical protein